MICNMFYLVSNKILYIYKGGKSAIKLRPFAIKFNVVDYLTERKKHIGNISPVGGI